MSNALAMYNMNADTIEQMIPEEKVSDDLKLCLEKAKYYYEYRPDIVKRLFVGLPKEIVFRSKPKNPGDNAIIHSYLKPQGVFDIYALIQNTPVKQQIVLEGVAKEDPYRRSRLEKHIIERVAHAYYHQVIVAKIPENIFESGAMSFGFCDIISYFGQNFIKMCETLVRRHDVYKLIQWNRVKVRFYLDNLDEILKAQNESVADIKNIEIINSDLVMNYPANLAPCAIKIDLSRVKLSILMATASYEYGGEIYNATWHLDTDSFKKNVNGQYASQYFKRPRAIATIKAHKELCKLVYGSLLSTVLCDGGDIDPAEATLMPEAEPEFNATIMAKKTYAADKLRTLNNNAITIDPGCVADPRESARAPEQDVAAS